MTLRDFGCVLCDRKVHSGGALVLATPDSELSARCSGAGTGGLVSSNSCRSCCRFGPSFYHELVSWFSRWLLPLGPAALVCALKGRVCGVLNHVGG